MNETCLKRFERNEADIEKLKSQDGDLNVRQARMEEKIDYTREEVRSTRQELKDVSAKLDKIIGQPAKRWETIINAVVIAAIVGLGTAFFMKG